MGIDRATEAYRIIDAHLAKTPFMVGGRLTIADLSLAGYVFIPEDTGIELYPFDHALWPLRDHWPVFTDCLMS